MMFGVTKTGSGKIRSHRLVVEEPEHVASVKQRLHDKQGIPSQERRLVFPYADGEDGVVGESFGEDILKNLDHWQAIVYENGKAIGRLVQPKLQTTDQYASEAADWNACGLKVQEYHFVFDRWRPVDRKKSQTLGKKAPRASVANETKPLSIAVGPRFQSSEYTVQLFGSLQGGRLFALPFQYRIPGQETGICVSVYEQRAQYIRKHKEDRKAGGKQPSGTTDTSGALQEDISIRCGSGLEHCVAVFGVKECPACLKSLVLVFSVTSRQTLDIPTRGIVGSSSSMPPAPSSAMEQANKDGRDGGAIKEGEKAGNAKIVKDSSAQDGSYAGGGKSDDIKSGPQQNGQTASSPSAKARKLKKKKNKSASKSAQGGDGGEIGEGSQSKKRASPTRTATPPSPQSWKGKSGAPSNEQGGGGGGGGGGGRRASVFDQVSTRSRNSGGEAQMQKSKSLPTEHGSTKKGGSEVNQQTPMKRKELLDSESGSSGSKHRGGHHRRGSESKNKEVEKDWGAAHKGSDSSSGSAGFARNVSLAIVEEVLRDLPSGSLVRPGRKQDMGVQSEIPSPPRQMSPRESMTVENGVVKLDVAFGDVDSAVTAALPKLQKTSWSGPSKLPTKSSASSGEKMPRQQSDKETEKDCKSEVVKEEVNEGSMSPVRHTVPSATFQTTSGEASGQKKPREERKPKLVSTGSYQEAAIACPASDVEFLQRLGSPATVANPILPSPAQTVANPELLQITESGGPTAVGSVSVLACNAARTKKPSVSASTLSVESMGGKDKVLGLNSQFYSEGGIGAVHREQLIFDMNDFDEEEVYIRRNRSGASLAGMSQHGLPGTPVATEANSEVTDGNGTSSATEGANGVKKDWRYANGYFGPSSPNGRVNFQFANGLLHGHAAEDDRGSENSSSSHQWMAGGGGAPCQGLAELPLVVSPVDVESVENGSDPSVSIVAEASVQNEPPGAQPGAPVSTQQNAPGAAGGSLAPGEGGEEGRSQFGAKRTGGVSQDEKDQGQCRADHDADSEAMYAPLPGPRNDLDRLLLQATPMLELDPTVSAKEGVENLTLEDVWSFYYEPSMFGREVYIHGGMRGPSLAYFLPYLSAVQIFTPTDVSTYSSHSDRMYMCDIQYWPKYMRLHFEQFESNPPWYRLPLHDTMNQLAETCPDIKSLRLRDLHPASWFCVAWYPLYRIPDAPLATRFLTYHTFHPALNNINTVYQGGVVPLPVYGLEWYNMRDEPQWLDNISQTKSPRGVDQQLPPSQPPQRQGGGGGGSGGGGVNSGPPPGSQQNAEEGNEEGGGENWENQAWQMHVRELRTNAKKFARGIGLRKFTRRGIEEANTHHHDFEYFYERN
ncbi:hypothetical protein BSKO_13272 [Bryopsis sp. KO-2023]|nr:hypothetical protein BSKO_13272 [Bryopsis sp. KO-2023]